MQIFDLISEHSGVIIIATIGQLLSAVVVAWVIHHFYKLYGRTYLRFWALSWAAFSIYLGGLLASILLIYYGEYESSSLIQQVGQALSQSAGFLQIFWLLLGSYGLIGTRLMDARRQSQFIFFAILLGCLVAFLGFDFMGSTGYSIRVFSKIGVRALIISVAFFVTSFFVLRMARNNNDIGPRFVFVVFLMFGLSQGNYFITTWQEMMHNGKVAFGITGPYLVLVDFMIQSFMGMALVVWFLEDERKKTLQVSKTLEVSEQKFQNLLSSIQDVVWAATFKKNQLIYINDPVKRVYGKDKEDVIRHPNLWLEMVHPDDQFFVKDAVKSFYATGFYDVEYRIVKDNGRIKWVNDRRTIFKGTESSDLQMGGIITDITARKVAEEKLKKQYKELKRTKNELNSFLYSASHDLRAPLMSMLGIIYLLNKEYPDEYHKMHMDKIEKSVNNLDKILKDIIDFSRNSNNDLIISEVDFNAIVDEILENYLALEVKTIEIKLNIQIKNSFYTGINRVKIILKNLIRNAITFSDPNKSLKFIEITIIADEDVANIKIADNGLGIGKEHQGRIFDMFFRAHEEAKGSGLGLYIAKEAVDKLGGSIRVESLEKEGTTFFVDIPNKALSASMSKS